VVSVVALGVNVPTNSCRNDGQRDPVLEPPEAQHSLDLLGAFDVGGQFTVVSPHLVADPGVLESKTFEHLLGLEELGSVLAHGVGPPVRHMRQRSTSHCKSLVEVNQAILVFFDERLEMLIITLNITITSHIYP